MAYSYALPDTSTRNKLMQLSQSFAPNIDPYYARLQQEGQRALQQSFGAAQQNIGAQFTPAMRGAQSFLGGRPLLADSGYANRLNRQLQAGAFGQLSNAYGDAAARQSESQLSALERLIQMRLGGQQDILAALLGTAQKKRSLGDTLGGVVGTGLGILGGSYLGAKGEKMGRGY